MFLCQRPLCFRVLPVFVFVAAGLVPRDVSSKRDYRPGQTGFAPATVAGAGRQQSARAEWATARAPLNWEA